MSEEALVPPDAVGWMVRVTRPPASEEFYFGAYEAKSEAEAAVRAHARVSLSNDVEGIATLSPSDLAEQQLQTGTSGTPSCTATYSEGTAPHF